jgi:hypothetical protein
MHVRITSCLFRSFLLVLVGSTFLFSQTPVSDPQALSLAAQAMAALTNGNAVSDITLTGSVTWVAGSDNETGTATLQAKGIGESRVNLNLSGGPRTEIRNDVASTFPQGASIENGGSKQPWALHRCWINASWFYPALSFLSVTSDPSLIFSYVGQENRGGANVQHLRVFRYLAAQKPAFATVTQRVSTADFYLDSTSLLPVALVFNAHPDDDAYTDISIEIDYFNYQTVNGVRIPFHIQKLVSGGLALDAVVTGISVNSGLSDDLFAIQ